jgi:3-isopropylmalate/(R)-2-methylmalate dehydratase small subunit
MQPFVVVSGVACPIDRPNIDTDMIIPKQFLKRIERSGYGPFLFFEHRYREDGSDNPDFVMNKPAYRGASILIAAKNFGCGSSREHAPWALADYGFRAVIAPSFADIFYNNSLKNGLLPVKLSEKEVETLIARATAKPGYRVTVDLEKCEVRDDEGFRATFDLDPFRRHCMLNGLDDIALTLQHAGDIAAFESKRPAWRKGVNA